MQNEEVMGKGEMKAISTDLGSKGISQEITYRFDRLEYVNCLEIVPTSSSCRTRSGIQKSWCSRTGFRPSPEWRF